MPPTPNQVTIGIFAPSSPFDHDRFERGVDILRGLGFSCQVHAQTHAKLGYLAGDDGTRLEAFEALLADPKVDVVMAARGGYGAHRLVERLDPAVVTQAKKPLVGFSDVTALHAVLQHLGLESIHGPVVTQLCDLAPEDLECFARVVCIDSCGIEYKGDGPIIRRGIATGRLVGGCLSVLVPLIGTPHLDWTGDQILLLEDVDEAPYRIDRMLTHLRLARRFDAVRGVALGDFVHCRSPRPNEQSVEDVLRDRLEDLGIPVLAGLPFGHGNRNRAITLGATVTLDADARILRVDSQAAK